MIELRRPQRFIMALLGACLSLSLPNASAGHDFWPPAVERGRYLMGTVCTATVELADTTRAGAALDRALETIARLEPVMSSWASDSELARFHAAGKPGFACSAELFAALSAARAWAESTGGAFDPTVEPINRIWDMRGEGRVPTASEQSEAAALVDWRALELDPATRRARLLRPGMGVDLGGIGKGLALDRAAETLRADRVDRAMINFGGQILALGSWEASVADPRDRLRPVFRVPMRNASLSTSAQSERGVDVAGRHRGHILDPRTAEPVAFEGSVSVLAPSALAADALSTALLIMGRERARKFAAGHPDIGVLWVEPSRGTLHTWKWNLVDVVADPGARIAWMTH